MNLHTLLYYLDTENGHAIVIIDIRNEYIYIYADHFITYRYRI